MARKIVQIAVAYAVADPEQDNATDRLFALCDDGSVWVHNWAIPNTPPAQSYPEKWNRLTDIPQEQSRQELPGEFLEK